MATLRQLLLMRYRALNSYPRVFSTKSSASSIPKDGLTFQDFLKKDGQAPHSEMHANVSDEAPLFHLKTYGCQMNVNDSDIVRSLLLDSGFREAADEVEANLLLTNTCAIREGAETEGLASASRVTGTLQETQSCGSPGVYGRTTQRGSFSGWDGGLGCWSGCL